MRGLMGRIGARVGVAVALVILIAGVVAVAKFIGDKRQQPQFSNPTQSTPAADPTAGDDGEVPATPSAYADDAAVLQAASGFTQNWLKRDRSATAWLAALKPLCTESVATSLQGVDPASVPATRAVSGPTMARRGELYALVDVRLDAGTLSLNLVLQGSNWLVSSIDWDRL